MIRQFIRQIKPVQLDVDQVHGQRELVRI